MVPSRSHLAHHGAVMPDPFLVILGFIALLCIILFPVRLWRQKHRRYRKENEGDEAGDEQ